MAAAAEGLAAYRLVLRAARRTFAGDRLMLQESAVEIRRRFEDHRGLAPGSDELARALEDAREAAFFIGHGIVQATRGPSGSFESNSFSHTSLAADVHEQVQYHARAGMGSVAKMLAACPRMAA
ncbi:hypothetical protein SEVIR_3G277800v4 [Setaria viridis]